VVADALSRKASCYCLTVRTPDTTLCQEMEKLNLGMIQHDTLTQLKLESVLLQRIIDAQRTNKGMKHIHDKMEASKANCFRKDDQGIIWFKDRIVVPKNAEVRQQILDEAHLSRYSIHPGPGGWLEGCFTFVVLDSASVAVDLSAVACRRLCCPRGSHCQRRESQSGRAR
jgi:hypothetical protein